MSIKKLVAGALVFALLLSLCGCGIMRSRLNIGVVISDGISEENRERLLDGLDKSAADNKLRQKQLSVMESVSADGSYAACSSLAENGCRLIIAFGEELEDGVFQAATEQSRVHFCMAEGRQENSGLDNYSCFSQKTFQSRYIAGVAAAMKLKDLEESGQTAKGEGKLGYLAEQRNAENISAFTAFFLGARSVSEKLTMDVAYAAADCDSSERLRCLRTLIADGCTVLSVQSDSADALAVCEENNAYYIGCSEAVDSQYYLCSLSEDYAACFSRLIQEMLKNACVPNQLSVQPEQDFISEINEAAFLSTSAYAGAQEKLSEVRAAMLEGSVLVFDTFTWTVNGERIMSTASDELQNTYFGIEYISEIGYFMENELSASPKFEFIIDGITEINYTTDIYTDSIGGQTE